MLDVVVCQCCGEVYLGGYRSRDDSSFVMVHDQPELERIPNPVQFPRRHGEYALFWPLEKDDDMPMTPRWTLAGKQRRWVEASLNPATGEVTVGRLEARTEQPPWLRLSDPRHFGPGRITRDGVPISLCPLRCQLGS